MKAYSLLLAHIETANANIKVVLSRVWRAAWSMKIINLCESHVGHVEWCLVLLDGACGTLFDVENPSFIPELGGALLDSFLALLLALLKRSLDSLLVDHRLGAYGADRAV